METISFATESSYTGDHEILERDISNGYRYARWLSGSVFVEQVAMAQRKEGEKVRPETADTQKREGKRKLRLRSAAALLYERGDLFIYTEGSILRRLN